MDKKQEIKILSGFWIIFLIMEFWFSFNNKSLEISFSWLFFMTLGFMLLHFIIFNLNYFWICPKTIPQKKWSWFILGQIFLILLFPTIRMVFEEIILYEITGNYNYNPDSHWTLFYYLDNFYYSLRIILFSLVFYFLKISWSHQQKINELQLEKRQAELQNLKNQLSPHFLFNTLNNFYADLMETQPKVAEDVLKLSDMLRYVTYESEKDEVLVKDEIEFLLNYIDLFNRRFDHTLHIEFDYPSKINSEKIPSLLLIHFVENALKHGISNDADSPIQIRLSIENQYLNFEVENNYIPQQSLDEHGIGYKNIKKRLDHLFNENYELKVEDNKPQFKVKLKIPTHI